jgi:phosphoglycerate-specific signal transduction histidine kinase
MDKQKLREQLQELHAELQQVESLDVSERETLQGLANDVREILRRGDDRTQHYSSLGDQLREVVAQVEASHPRVTMLMRQVIDQLAYLGI